MENRIQINDDKINRKFIHFDGEIDNKSVFLEKFQQQQQQFTVNSLFQKKIRNFPIISEFRNNFT